MSEQRVAGASSEQLLYARILAIGMYAGLIVLLVSFTLYISGAVEPAVPIDRLPAYWDMGVDEYLEAINTDYLHREHGLTGWWWLNALGKADYLNFIGIAVLSAVTIVCYAGIIPTLVGKRDMVYAAIALAETVILVLAASGIFSVGH